MSDVQNRKIWFKMNEMSIRDQFTKILDEQERNSKSKEGREKGTK